MSDVVIVGGGVIGLTAAWELAQQGAAVTVLDQAGIGTEASWAGAGMIPPAELHASPFANQLAARSRQLWPALSAQLRELTGIDNGFRACGALLIDHPGCPRNANDTARWQSLHVRAAWQSSAELLRAEPSLASHINGAVHLPEFAQVRNPRHLRALRAACEVKNVRFETGQQVIAFTTSQDRILAARTSTHSFAGDRFVLAAGAWSTALLQMLGIAIEIIPVRGQMLLLRTPQPVLTHVVDAGSKYLVPRDDGRLLVGATEERAGFEKVTTEAGLNSLLEFAKEVIPALQTAEVESSWAGLRPQAVASDPIIRRSEEWPNLSIATGHFRAGLSSSPATGEIIRKLFA